jgi:hypothetical protein
MEFFVLYKAEINKRREINSSSTAAIGNRCVAETGGKLRDGCCQLLGAPPIIHQC